VSWSSHIYSEELVWLKDLYISCGYPLAMVMQWIQSSKEDAYKNQLDWTAAQKAAKSECIWPLKSDMNLVWQKLNLGMVSESMCCTAVCLITDEDTEYRLLCACKGMELADYSGEFVLRFQSWFGRLVGSQKQPINFSNKENKHNQSLLGIQERHAKLALTGRSFDQRELDEQITYATGTLEDYSFTVTRGLPL